MIKSVSYQLSLHSQVAYFGGDRSNSSITSDSFISSTSVTMTTSLRIVLVLMIPVSMGYATRGLSTARELPGDSSGGDESSFRPSEAAGGQQLVSEPQRDGRKLIFINNTAYDLNDDEMAVYLNEGRVPAARDKLKRKPSMDAPLPALLKKSGAKERPRQKADDDDALLQEEPVKASGRFVADPEKAHLIQKVDKEEVQNLKKLAATTTTPKPDERVATEASEPAVETSTVRYEITQVSVLQFLWNEFKNIGDLLGREMIGTLSGTLYYLWETALRYVTNRSRREIQDASSEL